MSLAATPHASLAYAFMANKIGHYPDSGYTQMWIFEGNSSNVYGANAYGRTPINLTPANSAYVTGGQTSPIVDANPHQCVKFNLYTSVALKSFFTTGIGRFFVAADSGFTLAWLQKFDTNGPSDGEKLYDFGSSSSTGNSLVHYDEDRWGVILPANKSHLSDVGSLVPGTWQCVVFTYNTSTRAYQYWVNGVDGGNGTGPTGGVTPSASASIEFGPQKSSGDEYWLQYFMIHHDEIWTQADAVDLYNLSLAPTLYEVSGTVTSDSVLVARDLLVYSVEGNYVINSGTSNATTGEYTISTFGYSDPVYVMAVGDTGERWLAHSPVNPVAS